MSATREAPLIKQFLAAYEDGSWQDATLAKPDATDRTNSRGRMAEGWSNFIA